MILARNNKNARRDRAGKNERRTKAPGWDRTLAREDAPGVKPFFWGFS
jgi:hypothetical protein